MLTLVCNRHASRDCTPARPLGLRFVRLRTQRVLKRNACFYWGGSLGNQYSTFAMQWVFPPDTCA